jgi:glycerol-1-phosphate dehydrogenase [NAD(P)+]
VIARAPVLTVERLKATHRRAQMIRRRYTTLDLANETGILDDCADRLFAGDEFWAQQSAVH